MPQKRMGMVCHHRDGWLPRHLAWSAPRIGNTTPPRHVQVPDGQHDPDGSAGLVAGLVPGRDRMRIVVGGVTVATIEKVETQLG